MRISTLFSGIGAPEQGASRVWNNHEVVFACEWDKFARQSYKANYQIKDEHFHKDVNDLDGTKYKGNVDILVGGSPCQAFSIAGLRNGTDDERGQLIYQYIRVVNEVRAPIIVYENVKGMLSIQGGRTIKEFVQALRDIGYYCHYDVVNTKEYGVPQNRERIFLVGFIDYDAYQSFQFAPKVKLTKRLKDVLEDDVDEKYYLSYAALDGIKRHQDKHKELGNGFGATITEGYGHSNCLSARYYKDGSECLIRVQSATKKGYELASQGDSINLSVPNSTTRRGRVGKQVAQCLDTACNQAVVEPFVFEDRTDGIRLFADECCGALRTIDACGDKMVAENHRIRKLTPRECLRLQDFPDTFEQVVSDSQMYKQAGNSMSVNVLEMIFKQINKAINKEPSNTLMDYIND